ncbi:patatin-like phospholipase family protein [Patescibacteria group bacterium]|nr:patatin-like phospholipase family protein [Patescibacteria group bacterium]
MKNKELKIGLALGSGGFRGLSHIGVLKVLEENGIKISYLSGSSIGGLVAAYYAVFNDVKRLEEEVETWPMDHLYKFIDLSWTGGIITGNKFTNFLKKKFGDLNFSATKIPLKILTTNLIDGQPTILSSGKLIEAVRATVSVPLMFKPFKKEKKLLVDGALSSPVPLNVLKEMGADILIGVNLYHKNEFVSRKFTMPKVALRSTRIVLYNLAKNDIRQADVAICPDTSSIITNESLKKYNLATVKKLIQIGEESARKALPEIKAMLAREIK